jgi:hypothetical protein
MTFELVLAVVPPDIPNSVDWAYVLMDPFCHTEECHHGQQERDVQVQPPGLPDMK